MAEPSFEIAAFPLTGQLIAASFFVLATYVANESVRTLAGGHHPETS